MFDELKEVKYFKEVTDSDRALQWKKLNVQRVFKKQSRI